FISYYPGEQVKEKNYLKIIGLPIGIYLIVMILFTGVIITYAKYRTKTYGITAYEEIACKVVSDNHKYEDKEQYLCYINHMMSGVNISQIKSEKGDYIMADICEYYDGGMNSLMKYNTLFYIQKNGTGDGPKYNYLTYQDEDFAGQMNDILSRYYIDTYDITFDLNGIYISDKEFIPNEMTYQVSESDGAVLETGQIDIKHLSDEELELKKLKSLDIKISYRVGDLSNSSDQFLIYCGEIPSDLRTRVDTLTDEVISLANGQDHAIVEKSNGLVNVEYCVYNTRTHGDGSQYHIINYGQRNVLLDMPPAPNGPVIPMLFVIIIVAVILFIITFIITIIRIAKA
ncbi:MAG: hypothetical protein K6E10_11130, partial [Eubacterium sp.]|nr:hypothetical protein [Eubacterium sp.]